MSHLSQHTYGQSITSRLGLVTSKTDLFTAQQQQQQHILKK